MNKLILIILTIGALSGCQKDQIENAGYETINGIELEVLNLPEPYNLRAIHFIDNLTGIASGYNGNLIKSSDGGATWVKVETNTTVPLLDIDFVTKDIGFVVGGVMLKTIDGGNSWQKVELNLTDQIELSSIHFTSESVGFAIGHSSILKTTDGGNSWVQTKIENLSGLMLDIDFYGSKKGMIVCSGGSVVTTTDGGNSWNTISVLPGHSSGSISIAEDNVVYASGNTKIYKSTNFGESWKELPDSPTGNFDINFITPNIGFAVGRGEYSGGDMGHNYGAISYTTDKGESWTVNRSIVETRSLFQSSFPSDDLGYIVSFFEIVKLHIE